MSKHIQTYNSVRQTIVDCLFRFANKPETIREREIVIYCTYDSLDNYYLGCGWRFIGEKILVLYIMF